MQKKYQRLIQVTITLMVIFSVWTTAHAQLKEYTPLAPLPCTTVMTNGQPDCSRTAQTTTLEKYLPGLFNWTIGIAALMAFIMITFGGIEYMTSDSVFKTENGRKHITNAIYGLILVIGAYVILYTINPAILTFKLSINKPNIATSTPNGIATNLPTDQFNRANSLVVEQYRSNGISVNRTNACPEAYTKGVQQTGCTTLYGLPSMVLGGLVTLKNSCKCNLTITGGSEYHGEAPNPAETHGIGRPVVDIAPSSDLYSYLVKNRRNSSTVVPPRPINNTEIEIRDNNSLAVFTYEEKGANGLSTDPHWHVVFK